VSQLKELPNAHNIVGVCVDSVPSLNYVVPFSKFITPEDKGIVAMCGVAALGRVVHEYRRFAELTKRLNKEGKGFAAVVVAETDPSLWKNPNFVQTVNALSAGADGRYKGWIIQAVAKVDSSNYQAFIKAVSTLSEGEVEMGKVFLIQKLARSDPSFYQICE
jgi:hypothetical protein